MKPTDSELEILQVLWDRRDSSVREVFETLDKKDVGYTTILKLMQIMHDKHLVTRDSSCKTHVYEPIVSREETCNVLLNRMVKNLFNGNSSALVMQALGSERTSREDLEKIELFIRQLKNS